jgi:hypothetical protein
MPRAWHSASLEQTCEPSSLHTRQWQSRSASAGSSEHGISGGKFGSAGTQVDVDAQTVARDIRTGSRKAIEAVTAATGCGKAGIGALSIAGLTVVTSSDAGALPYSVAGFGIVVTVWTRRKSRHA